MMPSFAIIRRHWQEPKHDDDTFVRYRLTSAKTIADAGMRIELPEAFFFEGSTNIIIQRNPFFAFPTLQSQTLGFMFQK
jgi:hypothetical protein